MDKLQQATEYAKSGDKNKAKQILAELIQSEPNNKLAWLWMSGVVDNTTQQRYCLEQVLRIDPDNQHARTGLSKLGNLENPPCNEDQQVVLPGAREFNVKPVVNEMHSKYKSHPVPDVSAWSNRFTGWGIWPDLADPGIHDVSNLPPEASMGVLVAKAQVAAKRFWGWAIFLLVLAIAFGTIAVFAFDDLTASIVFGTFALLLLGGAFYETAIWYLNQDLTIRIFREGFVLTKAGKTRAVFWRDAEAVREQWRKLVIQGIIHISTHKIEIQCSNGQKVQLDRTLEKIEEIGRSIQVAVADHLLSGKVEKLKSGGTCEFGSFQINRQGITHKGKFLPWNEVKSLEIYSVGETTVRIHKTGSSKWMGAWASENGGTVLNLHLFTELANWFIDISKQPVPDGMETVPTAIDESFDGDVHYQLFVTKQEAQSGSQKTFYIGPSKQEKRLVVKIPAGIKSGTVYRFPDYGQPNPRGGTAGVLNVEVIVGKGVSLQAKLEEIQIVAGILLFLGGMIWMGFWSPFDLLISAILATLIGGLGGVLISVRKRWAGLISGAIGGLISYVIQMIYYILMYIFFGREEFWNYEMGIVLIVSVLPAIGLYSLITKKRNKQQA